MMEMCYEGTLEMPSSYAAMSEEEMTYVEGGMSTKVKLWGIQVALSGSETNAYAIGSSVYNYALGSALGIPAAAAGVLIGGIATFRGVQLTAYNSNNSGVYLNFTWAHIASMITNPITAPVTVALTVPIKDRW